MYFYCMYSIKMKLLSMLGTRYFLKITEINSQQEKPICPNRKNQFLQNTKSCQIISKNKLPQEFCATQYECAMRQVNVHPLSFLINYIFFHLITSMYFFTQEKTTQINLFNFFTANDKNHQGADKHAEETKTWKKKAADWMSCKVSLSVWFLFLCGHLIRFSLLTFWSWKNI